MISQTGKSTWKGKNRVYSVGFNTQGLLGVSMDAQRVADDIKRNWNFAHHQCELGLNSKSVRVVCV